MSELSLVTLTIIVGALFLPTTFSTICTISSYQTYTNSASEKYESLLMLTGSSGVTIGCLGYVIASIGLYLPHASISFTAFIVASLIVLFGAVLIGSSMGLNVYKYSKST